MKFKSNQKGSGAMMAVLAIAAVTSIWMTLQMQSISQLERGVFKNTRDSTELLMAHTVAALLKQDLFDNFQNVQAAYSSCLSHTYATPEQNFVLFLSSANITCPSTPLQFNHFVTNGGSHTVLASQFGATTFLTNPEGTSMGVQVQITSIGLQTFRIAGNISFTNQRQTAGIVGLTNNHSVMFYIDMNRALNANFPNSACHICRTEPGGICCASGGRFLDLLYLEAGSGRVMEMNYDTVGSTTIITPVAGQPAYPTAQSLKNIGATTTVYGYNNFKITALNPVSPLNYVTDTAQDGLGRDYFLTTTGAIFRADGSTVLVDPKLESIAYFNNQWYLLRSDGAVLTSPDIATVVPTLTGAFITLAAKIVSGAGTTNVF